MTLFSPEWWAALLAIIIVDLLLAGDNAVVIALAARNLPAKLKRRAIIWGTLGAIMIRVLLVFFVSKLLLLPGVSLIGGLLLYAIAVKLINDDSTAHADKPAAAGFWSAMSTIIIADTVMGLDNILAIAGAARGELFLIIFGLALSIPIMIGGSVLLLKCIEKLPWLVVLGAMLLCGIAGRIILDDQWLQGYYEPSAQTGWAMIIAVMLIVTAVAVMWKKRQQKCRTAAKTE